MPGIWSGVPPSADSLFCDMSTWRSPDGAGWWPTVAWRLFQLLTLAVLAWACWRLLGHSTYRIDIDVYRMGGRAWLDGGPLYADGATFETAGRAGPAVHLSPAGGHRVRPFALLPLPAASTAITVDHPACCSRPRSSC